MWQTSRRIRVPRDQLRSVSFCTKSPRGRSWCAWTCSCLMSLRREGPVSEFSQSSLQQASAEVSPSPCWCGMKLLLALHTSEGYQSKQEHLCALIILTEHMNPNLVRRSPSISLCGTWRWFPGLVKQPCCSLCCSGDGWQNTRVAVLAPAALLVGSRGGGSVGVFGGFLRVFPFRSSVPIA